MNARLRSVAGLLGAGALAGACATKPAALSAGPSYAPIPGRAATAHAGLYADCVGESVAARRYDVVTQGSSGLVRFACTGSPARALYGEFAAAASGGHGSRWTTDGRRFQSPQTIKHDLFGVDLCSTGGADDFRCEVVLNVGEFLTERTPAP